MKEDFVTYEQAISLANLGFDKYCTHYYWSNRPNNLNEVSPKTFGMYSIDYDFNYTEGTGDINFDDYVSAPNLAQVHKWLIKEKSLFIEVSYDSMNKCYTSDIWNIKDNKLKLNPVLYDSYDEALSASITECLKLLENE